MTLDEAAGKVYVLSPSMWKNKEGPANWYAVGNDDGIVAYFAIENDAYRFRLSEITRILNT